jgi:L-lactate dehydrogenase (cytochrome)
VARRRLPEAAFGYLVGGGEGESTRRRNRAAFEQWELIPAVLRDVSTVDTSTTVLGERWPLPFGLAPVGAPRLVHHEGELAVGRAATRAGIPYAVSTLASVALERIAQAAPGPRWFQLYLWGDRALARELIARAQAAGYGALLVTVDVTVRSKRERELRAGLRLPTPNLSLRTVLEGALHPQWWWRFFTTDAVTFPNVTASHSGGAMPDLAGMFDGSACWEDLDWILEAWDGPVVLKGVLSVEDARRAADAGVAAVLVSNHGGRQLDHVPATIDVLAGVVDAVGDRIEVLMDSGIRRGTDIVTALALGARAVLIGRAYLYGLAAAGEVGVSHAIDLLAEEVRIAMALSGAARVGELQPGLVHRRAVVS